MNNRCEPEDRVEPLRAPYDREYLYNIHADHHIWSTIKTLPATLPEPSSEVRGPTSNQKSPVAHGLRAENRVPTA